MSINFNQAGFQGKVIQRGDEAYEESVYQYAWSSYEDKGTVEPAAVIYALDDSDVQLAIKLAKQYKFGIAIRTGGHHYTGASSTWDQSIQVDVSDTYTDFTWDNSEKTLLTTGISVALSKLNSRLRKANRFIPTGQCSYVHLGGHLQTGGYGQLIRSFGLLADHVQKVRIITADGNPRWVVRGVEADKDLLYGILGGSPGNFGVITDVTLRVHRDEDHPESRGFRAQLPYNITALKALLDIMVEMDNDDSFAPDYDFCVSVNSARDEEHKPVGGIVVFAQWANLKGAGQLYDPTFFNKIRAACGGSGVMRPHDGIYMDDDKAPLSVLCSHWLFPIAREYQLPYYKRTYLSNSRAERLKQTGWTTWVTDRIQSLEGDHYTDNKNGVFVSCQFQYAGGRDSTYRKNGTDGYSSYSWRDSTFGCTLDAFYDEKVTNAKTLALDWVTKNDQEGTGHQGAKFSEQDRRLLWGSFDLNLPDRRLEYYDEHPTKYDRLSAIKLKNDPELIFTSNAFAVGPLPDRVTKALHKAQLCEHKYGFSLALHHQGDKAGDNMPSAHTLLCDEDAESKPSHKPMCLHAVGSKLDDIKRERIRSEE